MLTRNFRSIKFFEPDGSTGGSGSEPTVDQLKTERDHFKSLKDDAFKARDEYKSKLQELEAKIADAERKVQEEQGKYKELYETEAQKAKRLEDEAKDLASYKDKYSALEKTRRDELISKLPNDELKAVAAKIADIETLTAHVNATLKFVDKKVHTDDGRSGTISFNDDKVTSLKQLTYAQQQELKEKNPIKYKELFDQTYKI